MLTLILRSGAEQIVWIGPSMVCTSQIWAKQPFSVLAI